MDQTAAPLGWVRAHVSIFGTIAIVGVIAIALAITQLGINRTTVGGLWVGPPRCTSVYVDQTTGECNRLRTFGQQLLDQSPHAEVASVAVYDDPAFRGNISAGFHDVAIVAFKLADKTDRAFYVRCGAGIDARPCWDLRPSKPGDATSESINSKVEFID